MRRHQTTPFPPTAAPANPQGRTLHIAPAVKEQHEVTVTFPLPPLRRYYTTKPDHYISHLVGHEGPGSLLSALKARGWVTDLCAGVEDDGYGANSCCYLFRCEGAAGLSGACMLSDLLHGLYCQSCPDHQPHAPCLFSHHCYAASP
jgi:hypothetical protein